VVDNKHLRADIAVEHNDTITPYDVVVTNPAQIIMMRQQPADEFNYLAAAKRVEREKKRKYDAVYRDAHPDIAARLVPFALETTGAFGESAMTAIMERVGLTQVVPLRDAKYAAARNIFMRRVATIMANSRHQFVRHFQRQRINGQDGLYLHFSQQENGDGFDMDIDDPALFWGGEVVPPVQEAPMGAPDFNIDMPGVEGYIPPVLADL
jgi:hypothetical protein